MPVSSLDQHHNVSRAEVEALILVAKGLRNREVAEELRLSIDALRGRLFRFAQREDMTSTEVRIWASKHEDCCLRRAG